MPAVLRPALRSCDPPRASLELARSHCSPGWCEILSVGWVSAWSARWSTPAESLVAVAPGEQADELNAWFWDPRCVTSRRPVDQATIGYHSRFDLDAIRQLETDLGYSDILAAARYFSPDQPRSASTPSHPRVSALVRWSGRRSSSLHPTTRPRRRSAGAGAGPAAGPRGEDHWPNVLGLLRRCGPRRSGAPLLFWESGAAGESGLTIPCGCPAGPDRGHWIIRRSHAHEGGGDPRGSARRCPGSASRSSPGRLQPTPP